MLQSQLHGQAHVPCVGTHIVFSAAVPQGFPLQPDMIYFPVWKSYAFKLIWAEPRNPLVGDPQVTPVPKEH